MSFNLNKYAAKKEVVEKPIDKKLEDLKKPRKEPTSIGEVQLEDYRADIPTALTEKQLDKPRGKAAKATTLVEDLLDSGKHRNEETSKGNINKLEELRLSGKKSPVQEKEKFELASETPKDQQFPKKSEDGLRLAQHSDPYGTVLDEEGQEDFSTPGYFTDKDLEDMDMLDGLEQLPGEMDDPGEEDDDDDDYVIVEKMVPEIVDQGGTKLQAGKIVFSLESFMNERNELDRALLEEKIKEYLYAKYTFKTPNLGPVNIVANEGIGSVGYISPVR